MYKTKDIINTIIQGNSLSVLKEMEANSIDMIVTSPPYYGLRSYNTKPVVWDISNGCIHSWVYQTKKGISGGTKSAKVQIKGEPNFQIVPDTNNAFCEKCGSWLGELGQEPTYRLFVDHLRDIFMECARVLKPSGSMWINIADSYSGSNQGAGAGDKTGAKQKTNRGTNFTKEKGFKSLLVQQDIAKKSLMGIPDRLKIALIDKSLICRNEIIWHKPNQMPQSATDRFTNDFEKFYWFTKEGKYYFEQQLEDSLWADKDKKRNMRSTWSINTEASSIKHFATYPKKLIRIPIQSTCPVGGIVLDPFFGSGTTAVIANQLNRNWIGIELNPEYIEIANKRLGI